MEGFGPRAPGSYEATQRLRRGRWSHSEGLRQATQPSHSRGNRDTVLEAGSTDANTGGVPTSRSVYTPLLLSGPAKLSHNGRRQHSRSSSSRQFPHNGANSVENHASDDHDRKKRSFEGDSSRKKFDGPVFGFKRLFKFLSDSPDEVIPNIHRNLKEWEQLLDQDALSQMRVLKNGRNELADDLLYIVVRIIGEKICASTTVLASYQNAIVSSTIGSRNFRAKVDEKCKRYMSNGFDSPSSYRNSRPKLNNEYDVEQSPSVFFRSLVIFFRFIIQKMQSTALDFLQVVVPSVVGTLTVVSLSSQADYVTQLLREANELVITMKAMREEAERKIRKEEVKEYRRKFGLTAFENEQLHSITPPDDFREIPIVPAVHEIRSKEDVFLRTNKTSGAYKDADHYLDVQFRLLREDFVRPLRDGVIDFLAHKDEYLTKKKRPPVGNVRLYTQVLYSDLKLERGTDVHYVQLHPDNYQKVKWNKSKRLLSGSLLVFTSDNFQTAYFATVAQRNEEQLKVGKLAVSWEGESPVLNKNVQFLMIECEVYFEAYRYTLQVLKEIDLASFSMAKFIVEASSDVEPPDYLLENRHQMVLDQHTCSPLAYDTWPSAEELSLDQKQFEAFRACLTKEFAIVQGPPGTGKTFLALQVMEVFLKNQSVWNEDDNGGPILIVCYTNHALDQFLEGILRVFQKIQQQPKIVRVGGRSKTPGLEEFSLARLRYVEQSLYHDKAYFRMKREAQDDVRTAESHRQRAVSEFAALNNAEGILLLDGLEISKSLEEQVPEWILTGMKNPAWFGLNDDSTRISPEDFLKRRFRVCLQPVIVKNQANVNTNSVRSTQETVDNNVSDDEEDYDLEELEENRILDEVQGHVDAVCPPSSQIAFNYLFTAMKRELHNKLDSLEAKRKAMKLGNIVELNAEVVKVQSQLDSLNKKEEICKMGIEAYRNKAIEVTDVQQFFREDAATLPASDAQKWFIYFHVLERAKILAAMEVKRFSQEMTEAQKRMREVLRLADGRIISRSLVVGMTTTGAAKYNDLLRMSKSRIVIVEEAAEVLESHIVTCITPACQHLILIGDHQQLRPSTTVFELAKQYSLDISLFERMVNNKLNCYKINIQHRMRPEIADLVVGTIYPELYNADSVRRYPKVAGVPFNLFFIDHQHAESSEKDSKSKSNKHEANFMAAFCRYLIQNGYTPAQITILTTYTGQMFLIKQCLRALQTCQGVRVTCVDNFQGEENDIILLSLVRSNEKGNIGFLKTDNRICVAISRAKQGLFIIGNMKQLMAQSKTWKKIQEKLKNNGPQSRIGASLAIQCEIHGTVQNVSTDMEFSRLAPEGGCVVGCDEPLDCGHSCRSVCHIQDREHISYQCKERCTKVCCRGHQCMSQCYCPCPPCAVVVTKTLQCGHYLKVKCCNFDEDVLCYEIVKKMLSCGHLEALACHVDPISYKCKVKVLKLLPCEHRKEAECHRDPTKITCGEMVEKTLPCTHKQMDKCWKPVDTITCETKVDLGFELCDHKVTLSCVDSKKPGIICKSPCTSRLECGHVCVLICHKYDDPEHLHYKCKKDCRRLCENDLHRCKTNHHCFKPCPPCRKTFNRKLKCGHEAEMPCYVKPENYKCKSPCQSTLGCGHKCKKLCSEPCGPCEEPVPKRSKYCGHEQVMPCYLPYTTVNCDVKVPASAQSTCGHNVLVSCSSSQELGSEELPDYCTENCGFKFDQQGGCGHKCQGSCRGCWQGRIHEKCKEKCGKTLVCGHVCDFPCSEACPPCQKKCLMACEHSKCERACGEPCNDCVEKCGWRCKHIQCTRLCSDPCDREPCEEPCKKKLRCGHECIGFCGEPCPSQCRVCDRKELTEDFFLLGFEEDDDARFVLLEDCGHAIEVNGLTYYMENDVQAGEISAKRCPRCSTLIRRSRRFGNILKVKLNDVMKVKKYKFGKLAEIKPQVETLAQRIYANETLGIYFEEIKKFLISSLTFDMHNGKDLLCKKVDTATLASLETISNHLEEAARVMDDEVYAGEVPLKRTTYKSEIRNQYLKLFKRLMDKQLPLSKQEIEDFDKEFGRVFDLNQIFRRSASSNFSSGHSRAFPIYIELIMVINNVREPYTEARKAKVRDRLKELDEVLKTGLGISDRERKEILAAINLREGRWFKCPNGHVYLITECGGAMEQGRCNECGATIGGGNHRLRSDNALASEMDGATVPLWPNMVD